MTEPLTAGKLVSLQPVYLECTLGSHNKFWEAVMASETDPTGKSISLQYAVYVGWGVIGHDGQRQVKRFTSQHSAASFMDTKMREKGKKGYLKKARPPMRMGTHPVEDEVCLLTSVQNGFGTLLTKSGKTYNIRIDLLQERFPDEGEDGKA